jgi:hypothetical protein
MSRLPLLVFIPGLLYGQTSAEQLLNAAVESAEAFRQTAPNLVSRETLVQRCYRLPAHGHVAIGRAAEALPAQDVVNEIVSEYRLRTLEKDTSGNLFEIREVVASNGVAAQTPAAALRALQMDASIGEARIRRRMMTVFTRFGLVDIATDYAPILLAFTRAGLARLVVKPAGARYYGAEEAFVFDWEQKEGGLFDLSNGKAVRRPMHGEFWVRRPDGQPLRVTAIVEHDEKGRRIRDEGDVEFVQSAAGIVVPVTAVHRRFIDDLFLTENLYRYGPFRLFSAESGVHFEETPPPK